MPLVDDSELHQQDEGGHNIVEVVLAVVELGKGRVVQPRVPAVEGGRVAGAPVEEGHLALEQLHPHHGKYVVDHLEKGGYSELAESTSSSSWRSVQLQPCV